MTLQHPMAVLLAAGILALPQLTAGQQAPGPFQFRFAPGQPLSYAITTRMKVDMDMRVAGEGVKTSVDFTVRYTARLTPKGPAAGDVTTLAMATSDVQGDWNISGPAGNIVLKLRGQDVTGTQNGAVIIDTQKEIGTAQAKDIKREMAALYLSGQMDLDSRGRIREFRGDIPFVEFWKEANQASVGFFGIVFPENPVPVGGTWTEKVVLKKMGEIHLEGEGLPCTVTFTRQPDTSVGGRPVAQFRLAAPFSQNNLVGRLEQLGETTRLNIPVFRRQAAGTVRFDPQQGLLLEADTKIDADASMNASVQGQQLNMAMKIEADLRLKWIPEGAGQGKDTPPPE